MKSENIKWCDTEYYAWWLLPHHFSAGIFSCKEFSFFMCRCMTLIFVPKEGRQRLISYRNFTSSEIPKEQLLILFPLYIFKYSRTLEGNFGVSIIYPVKKMLFHSRTSTRCIKNLQSPLSSNSTFWMDFKMKCI